MTSLLTELRRRNVIRVAGAYLVLSWLLLQIGEVTFDFLDVPGWAGKLLIALLALGFIPTVIFAWAFELTPDGIKRESEIDRSQTIAPETGRKLDYITMAMVERSFRTGTHHSSSPGVALPLTTIPWRSPAARLPSHHRVVTMLILAACRT